MEDVTQAHTLRVYSVRPTVDDTTLPFTTEQPMFGFIRLFSRYILISN